jgi:hypothetical protein
MINPYELLGVDYKTSLKDVKKAYYNIALLVHPDRGGNDEEMVILQNSYNWIKSKLEILDKKGDNTIEEAEEEFKKFLEDQESKRPPKINAIFAESIGFTYIDFFNKYEHIENDLKNPMTMPIIYDLLLSVLYNNSFINESENSDNKKWLEIIDFELKIILENNKNQENDPKMVYASVQHGYGESMINKEESELIKFDKLDIKVYQEPESIFLPSQSLAQSIETTAKLDDYSLKTEKLYMCDYKKAYTELENPEKDSQFSYLFDGTADEPFESKLEKRMNDRK